MESIVFWKLAFYGCYAGLVVAVSIIGFLINKLQKDNERIEKQIITLNSKIDKISELNNNISNLKESINIMNNSLTQLITTISEFKGYVEGKGNIFMNFTEDE